MLRGQEVGEQTLDGLGYGSGTPPRQFAAYKVARNCGVYTKTTLVAPTSPTFCAPGAQENVMRRISIEGGSQWKAMSLRCMIPRGLPFGL